MAVTMPDPESTVPQGNSYLYFTTIKKNLKETKKENGLNKQKRGWCIHCLETNMVITVSCKKHPWLLNQLGKTMMTNRVFTPSEGTSPQDTASLQEINRNMKVKKASRWIWPA